MRDCAPLWGLALLVGCGGRDLSAENTAACEVTMLAEAEHLGDCVEDVGSDDCEAQHDSDACDWVVHYVCREYAANDVADCTAEGAVEAWQAEVDACPDADCTPYSQDRPFFGEDETR
jgi:hypothetical protein